MMLSTRSPAATPKQASALPLALAAFEAFGAPDALVAVLGPEAAAVPWRLWQSALHEPAASFLSEPGKGFRASLVQLGWELGGGAPGGCPAELAVALEWLHAGSLIVDDIEDGSMTRRGRPALHVSHGLPLALNTGNTLYFQAQLLLTRAPLASEVRVALQDALTETMVRCHHGQALDLAATVETLAQGEVAGVVQATTALKTGALTGLAAFFGARAAGATGRRLEAIARFGGQLGVALQMLDDLGGVLSTRRRAKAEEDLVGGHPTWAWAWLSEVSDAFTFARLQAELRAVRAGADCTPLLAELRERLALVGRARVETQADRLVAELRRELGDTPQIAAAEAEIERLRRSYV
jgi:geranylgeranyl pyrophosphate synthase